MASRLLSLCWLAGTLLYSAAAQDIAATNSTPPEFTTQQVSLVIGVIGNQIANGQPYSLLPLAMNAVEKVGDAITGPATAVNSTGSLRPSVLTSIVFLQCDALNSSSLVTNVLASHPQATIFYSNTSSYCNFTAGTFVPTDYISLWTTTNATQGQWILNNLQNVPSGSTNFQARLINISKSNSPFGGQPSSAPAGSGGGGGGGGGTSSTNVAMIILYSITGVITALFLIIIVTGAIRAHRHPERYGPRNILGRTRQSRARGLARAIVETLPIVKFGEQEAAKPGAGDLELASEGAGARTRAAENGALLNDGRTSEDRERGRRDSRDISAVATPEPDTKEEENPGCSICTDDFERGQDVRVLPCQHTFHPACIDPWLLNVSGTCPLCRVDLRPVSAHSNRTTTSNFLNIPESEAGSRRGSFAPPLTEDGRNRRASRFSLFGSILSPERMEYATRDERIEALRRAREQRLSVGGEDEGEARRRRRLTARLQDAFHIRTRARSASRSRPGTPQADADVPDVPEVPHVPGLPQMPPPVAHADGFVSHTSLAAPPTSPPPELSPISPLQSPVSMNFAAHGADQSRRVSEETPRPAASSTRQ